MKNPRKDNQTEGCLNEGFVYNARSLRNNQTLETLDMSQTSTDLNYFVISKKNYQINYVLVGCKAV